MLYFQTTIFNQFKWKFIYRQIMKHIFVSFFVTFYSFYFFVYKHNIFPLEKFHFIDKSFPPKNTLLVLWVKKYVSNVVSRSDFHLLLYCFCMKTDVWLVWFLSLDPSVLQWTWSEQVMTFYSGSFSFNFMVTSKAFDLFGRSIIIVHEVINSKFISRVNDWKHTYRHYEATSKFFSIFFLVFGVFVLFFLFSVNCFFL